MSLTQYKKNKDANEASSWIKTRAIEHGFMSCGISEATFLEEDANTLEQWLNKGMHGKMSYMERNFDKRLDPRLLVDDAKVVISLMYNYYPKEDLAKDGELRIAKYAYGKDYHFVVKDKCRALLEDIFEKYGERNARVFVDSAPVMERTWAKKSGLGWIGKNSLLLSKKKGSFFFLAEIIIDLDLATDHEVGSFCGSCSKCIDACPTEAITSAGIVDASKCISYLTIELKADYPIDETFKGNMSHWVFGCDTCQDVCPWNRFSKPHQESAFEPHEQLKEMRKSDWQEITQEVFSEIFRKSAVKRTKLKGLERNINFVIGDVE